jgi:uncharacterized membrane protein
MGATTNFRLLKIGREARMAKKKKKGGAGGIAGVAIIVLLVALVSIPREAWIALGVILVIGVAFFLFSKSRPAAEHLHDEPWPHRPDQ